MCKTAFLFAALAGAAFLPVPALAGMQAAPAYVGPRSVDPEKETVAYLPPAGQGELLGFVPRARYFGPVTNDPEKNTFAYQALIVPAPGPTPAPVARLATE